MSNYINNGFKLLSLNLKENSLLGTIDYNFIDQTDQQNLIYTTVIIGPNGTGKSNLFRILIELFRELHNLQQLRGRLYQVDGQFKLRYSLNNDIYFFSNVVDSASARILKETEGKLFTYIFRNGEPIQFEDVYLPLAIVANSIMVTDKFPVVQKPEEFPIYKYLGVRNNPQNASTRSYVRKTVQFIIEGKDNHYFIKSLARITEFLGINQVVEIFYTTINGNIFFSGNLTVEIFKEFFIKIQSAYKDKEYPPQKLTYYNRIKDETDQIESICNFCNRLTNANRAPRIRSNSTIRKITYNIISEDSFKDLKDDRTMLDNLRILGILSPPEISLRKDGSYALQESSSGEYHLFSSIVGLMATVKSNSLVFLDEPEISLHPNWQMKYLSLVRTLFSDPEYGTSHIMVATHSHYIISDLKGDTSKIIGLRKADESDFAYNQNKIEVVHLPYDLNTYGWSAEEVLYKIFNVKTTRNYYLEFDLRELLYMISTKSDEKLKMNQILNRIKDLEFSDADPINLIINKAEEYLSV